eukprot:scaffold1562_cov170-Amphora_coffeaeformis.AAC.5
MSTSLLKRKEETPLVAGLATSAAAVFGSRSHWSFGWYALSFGSSNAQEQPCNGMTDWSAKEDEIAECLQGDTDHQTVNLWQLRELALSPGGLVSPEWRKRAWPKLVSAHQQMIMQQKQPQAPRPLTRSQKQALQTDLRTTVWNVEEELQGRRLLRQQEQAEIDALVEEDRLRNKRVKFAPIHDKVEEEGENSTTPKLTSSPTNSDVSSESEENSISRFSYTDQNSGTLSPSTVATQETNFVSLLSTCSSNSSRAVRGRKATVSEQRILYTLITNLLQQTPVEQPKLYTYHPGFQDLVALLLLNLESPTMTSLVLRQCASHHWKYLLTSKSHLEGFLSATFMPLLQEFDSALATHLQNQGMKLPTFCRSWVSTWFASDTQEASVASRLLDVLLVSHPFMVVYLCVACVAQYRAELLPITDFCLLAKTLRILPQEVNDSMVEDVIAKALQYMERLPPIRLQSIVHNLLGSTTTIDLEAPAWLTTNVAPNDWAIIERRWDVGSKTSDGLECKDKKEAYPLATVATEQSSCRSKISHRKAGKFLLLLLVLVTAVASVSWLWPFLQQTTMVMPLQHLPAQRRHRLLSSRRAAAASQIASYSFLASMETDTTHSGKGGAVVVSPTGEGGASAGQPLRLPWWSRFRRAFRSLFDYQLRFLEKWF